MWWHGGTGLIEQSERGSLSAVATHDVFCVLIRSQLNRDPDFILLARDYIGDVVERIVAPARGSGNREEDRSKLGVKLRVLKLVKFSISITVEEPHHLLVLFISKLGLQVHFSAEQWNS